MLWTDNVFETLLYNVFFIRSTLFRKVESDKMKQIKNKVKHNKDFMEESSMP